MIKSFFANFIPDFYLDDICALDAEFLRSRALKGLILDVDNTLAPRGSPRPSERVFAHIMELRANGIKVCLISNNGSERVSVFNEHLALPVYPKAGKPSAKAPLRAARDMGLPPESVAVAGDQIFTDVLAGKRAGMTAVLIKPIEPFENPFFCIKRLLELPFIHYRKKHGGIS